MEHYPVFYEGNKNRKLQTQHTAFVVGHPLVFHDPERQAQGIKAESCPSCQKSRLWPVQ